MKQCKKCGKELELDQFYVQNKMLDGHLNVCKECTKARIRDHRTRNIDKIQAYDRERGRSEKRRLALDERQKRQKEQDKTAYNEKRRLYNSKREKIKNNARQKLERAVNSGLIRRPNRCDDCGVECKPHGHHEDYSLPLNVIWVCTACHGIRHRKD